MPFKIHCVCGTGYQVAEHLLGKKVKCSKCGHVISIDRLPTQSVPDSPPPPPQQSYWQPSQAHPQAQTRQRDGWSDSADEAKRRREDAILEKHLQNRNPTLEERIAQRQRDRIEGERVTNGVEFIIYGLIGIALAVGVFFLFKYVDDNGAFGAPRLIVVLNMIVGKWFASIAIGLFAVYYMIIGIGSLFRVVDIDDQESFPDRGF